MIVAGLAAGLYSGTCLAGNGEDVANGTEYTRFSKFVNWSD